MFNADSVSRSGRLGTIIYHVLLWAGMLVLAFKIFGNEEKIAYVDSAKIFNEYKGAQEAKQAYGSKTKLWQANVDTLASEVQSAIKKYEKSLAVMSPTEQSLAKQLIQAKQKQLADYQRGIQENARQEDGKLTQAVVSEINSFLTKYGKEHHYKLILIANASGTIAYAREGLDITNKVIEELNSSYVK